MRYYITHKPGTRKPVMPYTTPKGPFEATVRVYGEPITIQLATHPKGEIVAWGYVEVYGSLPLHTANAFLLTPELGKADWEQSFETNVFIESCLNNLKQPTKMSVSGLVRAIDHIDHSVMGYNDPYCRELAKRAENEAKLMKAIRSSKTFAEQIEKERAIIQESAEKFGLALIETTKRATPETK